MCIKQTTGASLGGALRDALICVPLLVWTSPDGHRCSPSLTRFSLNRLFRMEADKLPLASRMPVSMASLLRSDSVNPFRNSSNYRHKNNICLKSWFLPQSRAWLFWLTTSRKDATEVR